jgi:hypothetical protein
MGHGNGLLVTNTLFESRKSQLPTTPTRQRPPRQRLGSEKVRVADHTSRIHFFGYSGPTETGELQVCP